MRGGAAQFHAAAEANRRLHWMKKPKDERTIDRFAEALSETGSVAKSARATDIKYEYGRALLKRIRAKLGEQAR